jgi:hypothetical protein
MFLVLFLKRTNTGVGSFLGQPQTPWLRFAEDLGLRQPRRANVFGSLKRTNSLSSSAIPVAPFRGGFGLAERMFLVLFLGG